MTPEQKLEKCKDLVEKWRIEHKCTEDIALEWCADELQALLEEDDEQVK